MGFKAVLHRVSSALSSPTKVPSQNDVNNHDEDLQVESPLEGGEAQNDELMDRKGPRRVSQSSASSNRSGAAKTCKRSFSSTIHEEGLVQSKKIKLYSNGRSSFGGIIQERTERWAAPAFRLPVPQVTVEDSIPNVNDCMSGALPQESSLPESRDGIDQLFSPTRLQEWYASPHPYKLGPPVKTKKEMANLELELCCLITPFAVVSQKRLMELKLFEGKFPAEILIDSFYTTYRGIAHAIRHVDAEFQPDVDEHDYDYYLTVALTEVMGQFPGDGKVTSAQEMVPVLQPPLCSIEYGYWALLWASRNPDELLRVIMRSAEVFDRTLDKWRSMEETALIIAWKKWEEREKLGQS
jgi:hypothetical protein